MNKPSTKKERNAAKALTRSKRNSPRPTNHISPRKRRRETHRPWKTLTSAAHKAGESVQEFTLEVAKAMTVSELRDHCTTNGIKFTTKLRKPELINLLIDDSSRRAI